MRPGLDAYRRNDHRFDGINEPLMAIFQEHTVGVKEGLDRTAIIPALHRSRLKVIVLIQHELEGIGEIKLPLDRTPFLHHPFDALHQARPVLQIVHPDHRQVRWWKFRLLNETHDTVTLKFHEPKASWVVYLAHPN